MVDFIIVVYGQHLDWSVSILLPCISDCRNFNNAVSRANSQHEGRHTYLARSFQGSPFGHLGKR